MIKAISITDGDPSLALPLTFVVSVSMIKDIIENYKRIKSDNEENSRMMEVGNT
jgi:hypothetical protein